MAHSNTLLYEPVTIVQPWFLSFFHCVLPVFPSVEAPAPNSTYWIPAVLDAFDFFSPASDCFKPFYL